MLNFVNFCCCTDCCDGSDEWANNLRVGICENSCEELGKAAREEAERVQKIFMAGHEIRAQLISRGKELRLEKQVNYCTKKIILKHIIYIHVISFCYHLFLKIFIFVNSIMLLLKPNNNFCF